MTNSDVERDDVECGTDLVGNDQGVECCGRHVVKCSDPDGDEFPRVRVDARRSTVWLMLQSQEEAKHVFTRGENGCFRSPGTPKNVVDDLNC